MENRKICSQFVGCCVGHDTHINCQRVRSYFFSYKICLPLHCHGAALYTSKIDAICSRVGKKVWYYERDFLSPISGKRVVCTSTSTVLTGSLNRSHLQSRAGREQLLCSIDAHKPNQIDVRAYSSFEIRASIFDFQHSSFEIRVSRFKCENYFFKLRDSTSVSRLKIRDSSSNVRFSRFEVRAKRFEFRAFLVSEFYFQHSKILVGWRKGNRNKCFGERAESIERAVLTWSL